MRLPILAVSGLLALAGCREPSEGEKIGKAMHTAVVSVLKGQPLDVDRLDDVYNAGKLGSYERHAAGIWVTRTNARFSTYFRVFFLKLCDEPEVKCWHVQEIIETRSVGTEKDPRYISIDIYKAAPLPPQGNGEGQT
jgi:hypothetical protein